MQKDFPSFPSLSVDEYQQPEVKTDLFESYLRKYQAFESEKERDEFEEKVARKDEEILSKVDLLHPHKAFCRYGGNFDLYCFK